MAVRLVAAMLPGAGFVDLIGPEMVPPFQHRHLLWFGLLVLNATVDVSRARSGQPAIEPVDASPAAGQ